MLKCNFNFTLHMTLEVISKPTGQACAIELSVLMRSCMTTNQKLRILDTTKSHFCTPIFS